MLFWQFSNIIIYVKIIGKIPDQNLSVWLLSNPGDKVQILVESTGQICPVVLHLFWTLSPGFENNHTFKCWSGIFPTILTYMIMLENCQNNISVYGCSPIQGTKFYSCQNFSSLALSVWAGKWFEDLEEKDRWLTDKAVYRTAPAKPGLLNIYIPLWDLGFI